MDIFVFYYNIRGVLMVDNRYLFFAICQFPIPIIVF